MMDPALATPLATLGLALLVDCLLGEYPTVIHPVVWIGKLTAALLRLAPRAGWWRQLAFGVFLAVGVTAGSTLAVCAALRLVAGVPVLEILVGAYLLKASFALRELGAAGERVRAAIEAGDLHAGRAALRSLCSRDPTELGGEELLEAAIESLAENASDSFVAPLFFFALFGVPGAIAYRAINTLDAMVGYRGPLEALGKTSARLDDAANWLPARIIAVLFLLAGWVLGLDVRGGWRVLCRDGAKTPSPNGGRPMAVMAGLLGVRLEKKGVYALGEPCRPVVPATVRRAWRVVALAGLFAAGLCVLAVVGRHFLPAGRCLSALLP